MQGSGDESVGLRDTGDLMMIMPGERTLMWIVVYLVLCFVTALAGRQRRVGFLGTPSSFPSSSRRSWSRWLSWLPSRTVRASRGRR
jgi:hypothetical protein